MSTLRKLVQLDARFVQWVAGRLGFWRIDAIWHLARAAECDKLAAQLQAAGFATQAGQMRDVAARRRRYARLSIPARAPDSWHQAAA